MKKSMRIAAALLVLVMMTTCFVGGTFAKYITNFEAKDNARVAYWGFNAAEPVEIDLFDTTYDVDSTNPTVVSANGDNLVAPGTKKEATVNFSYTGMAGIDAPEVDYTFDVELMTTDSYQVTFDENGRPVYTQTGSSMIDTLIWYLNGEACSDYADLKAKIEALAKNTDGTNTFKAGELPAFLANGGAITIGWEWPFSVDDAVDTALGNDTATGNDVELTLVINATQID